MSAGFRCYLEAFYRGSSRQSRSLKGKDRVRYQYLRSYNDCRISTWSYDAKVFAAAIWVRGAQYLWLSKPPGARKPVLNRCAAVLIRYCDRIKGPPPAWTNDGKLFIYIPDSNYRAYHELTIYQRIKQLWKP